MADTQSTHETAADVDGWAKEHIARMMVCPVCFGQVAKQNIRTNRGIVLATLVCTSDHLFSMSWGLAQVTA